MLALRGRLLSAIPGCSVRGVAALHACAALRTVAAAASSPPASGAGATTAADPSGAAANVSAAMPSRREVAEAASRARAAATYYDPSVAAGLTARERQVVSSLADEPPAPLMADHGLLYGTTPAQLAAHLSVAKRAVIEAAGGGPDAEAAAAAAAAMVARALSTRSAGVAGTRAFRKSELLKKFAGRPHDTGDSRVQVAMLTDRIQRVSAHLLANKKDQGCRRALTTLTVRRRKLLEYMTRRDFQGYRVVVQELGLRPVPLVYDRHLPKQRTETHAQINERNRRLKNRVSRGAKGH